MKKTTFAISLLMAVVAMGAGPAEDSTDRGALDAKTAARFAGLALDCVHREYPNKIAHVLNGDEDVRPPRELTPAFYGCFDWHSAVHGHWLLVRLTRLYPDTELATRARAALGQSLTPAHLSVESSYLEGEGRASFERPYGLAWLLQLAAELREWDDDQGRDWSAALEPLEGTARARLQEWLPKLSHPIRTGEHSQTAFALGLALDWARGAGDEDMARLLKRRTRELYLADRDCPLAYEPSGQDFLSPCIAEADVVRRVLPPAEFAAWLGAFLPGLPLDGSSDWLEPAVVTDPTDGKLVHLDGLNLSRAWMLEGVASGLPQKDPRRAGLLGCAAVHARSGLTSVSAENYEGAHWLASFAVYLVTGRGLSLE